jgi:hypothetical protein
MNFVTENPKLAKVAFEYKAQETDELDLRVGELVVIANTIEENEGGYRGIVSAKQGLFPANVSQCDVHCHSRALRITDWRQNLVCDAASLGESSG